MTSLNPADTDAKFQILKLKRSFEGFGLLLDYLSRIEPFSTYDLGNFASALRRQLAEGEHCAAISPDRRLIGYCGWLPTSTEIAEAWMTSKGPLLPLPAAKADAVALTVVAAHEKKVLMALIQRARAENASVRVFFKRDYDANGRPARKSTVVTPGSSPMEPD